jgi:hypothetical protein
MATLFAFPPIHQKPGPEAQLDPQSPFFTGDMLLCALFSEGAGNIFGDRARGQRGTLQTGAASWKAGRTGWAYNFGTGTTEVRFANSTNYPGNSLNPLTVLALIRNDAASTNSNTILNFGETADNNSQVQFGIKAGNLSWGVDGNGSASLVSSGLAVTNGTWTVVGCSQASASRRIFGTYDFKKLSLATNTTAGTGGTVLTSNPWIIGRGYLNSALEASTDFQGLIEFVFVWKREFNQNQLIDLLTNPYQVFVPPSVRRWFLPVNGGIATQTISAVGIASGELFGVPTATPGDASVAPVGVASGEVFGLTQTVPVVAPVGITSGEIFGVPSSLSVASVLPIGVPSGERFGVATTTPGAVSVSPAAIGSAETFGVPSVLATASVAPSGIPTAEALGAVSLLATASVSTSGITSGERFGVSAVSAAYTVALAGIPSAENLGAIALLATATLAPIGIRSAESFGVASLSATATIAPSGVASGEAFGSPTITPGPVSVSPLGIPSAETSGTASISLGGVSLALAGIPSAERFGLASIAQGPASIAPAGIPSGEAFGAAQVVPGAVSVSVSGISSGEAFGTIQTAATAFLGPAGIASGEVFGSAALILGPVVLTLAGITSAETFGTVALAGGGLPPLPVDYLTGPVVEGSGEIDPNLTVVRSI